MPIPEKIQTAIDALNAIDHDDINALDDDTLNAFYGAICGPSIQAELLLDIRKWQMRDIRENTDTAWPDALETAA